MFTSIDKMIVAALTPIVLGLLNNMGVAETMTVGDAVPVLILAVIGAVTVYLVPNKVK